jgi:hypothetical protein
MADATSGPWRTSYSSQDQKAQFTKNAAPAGSFRNATISVKLWR